MDYVHGELKDVIQYAKRKRNLPLLLLYANMHP